MPLPYASPTVLPCSTLAMVRLSLCLLYPYSITTLPSLYVVFTVLYPCLQLSCPWTDLTLPLPYPYPIRALPYHNLTLPVSNHNLTLYVFCPYQLIFLPLPYHTLTTPVVIPSHCPSPTLALHDLALSRSCSALLHFLPYHTFTPRFPSLHVYHSLTLAVPINRQYWAAGTGYGHSGAVGEKWDVEAYLAAQREQDRLKEDLLQANTMLQQYSTLFVW